MAYSTQTRVTPSYAGPFRFRWEADSGSSGLTHGFHSLPGSPPMQTTTSFRTGGSLFGDEDALDLGTDQLSARKSLNAEFGARQKGKTRQDTGHTFETNRDETILSHPAGFIPYISPGVSYKGPIYPNPLYGVPSAVTWPEMPDHSLDWYGTAAIKRTTPTNPSVDLAVFLAELMREGIPAAPGKQAIQRKGKSRSADAGSEYLNYEFGWKPVISEVQQLATTVKNLSEIVAQFERDSGKAIRRSTGFPRHSETSVRTGIGQIWDPTFGGNFQYLFQNARNQGRLTETYTYDRDVWFSGAYMYHLPKDSGMLANMKRYEAYANRLLGVRITPEVLWELAPWSWFADWFGNVGDLLSNAVALSSDGLVLQYGYVMCEETRSHTIELDPVPLQAGGHTPRCSVTYRRTRKRRIRATPYGFGLNPSGFSLRQSAILTALGLTKGGGSLP